MAIMVLTNPRIEFNGQDYSSYAKKVSFPYEAEAVETTAFGSAGARTRVGGLKDGSLSITWNNDFAAGALDAAMWALLGTVVTCKVRPTASSIGTSNPEYQGSCLIDDWTPLDTAVGELVEVETEWPLSGAVTRATS